MIASEKRVRDKPTTSLGCYKDMKLSNPHNLNIVDSFIRLYGNALGELGFSDDMEIEFLPLSDDENEYADIIVRLGRRIYLSEREIGRLGLSAPELFAAIAHEIGHIVYHTSPWDADAESRADTLAAQLGLGEQMIAVIEKIIASRRYRNLTSLLVQRIHFLQHLA